MDRSCAFIFTHNTFQKGGSGESLKTSVRTRTRLEQLTGEGHYTGGTVAFGYKRVRLGRVNKKNQEVCDLVIDEAEAEIVRLIFH